ncbi:MAG: aspartate/glutamate racemase family protein [Desulfovibrionales bacterium]|nr:aspartate/glutamate racemase family protein [Desulfovibrionales bacterium]
MSQNIQKIIGVIGGMGNEAMADLAEKIAVESGSSACPFVFFGNSRLAYKPDEVHTHWKPTDAPEIRKKQTATYTCRLMQHFGCSTLGLACNSAHELFRSVMRDVPVSFVDMLHATARSLRGTHSKVLVLGVTSLVESGLYQQALATENIDSVSPSAANQQQVMQAIYDTTFGIKTSTITQEAEQLLCNVVTEECANHSVSAVVLGCTELPLVFTPKNCERFRREGLLPAHCSVIDASSVLAKQLLCNSPVCAPLSAPVETYRTSKTDWFAPATFTVTSPLEVALLQRQIMKQTQAFLRRSNRTVSGSYMHLPTLFLSEQLSDAHNKARSLGCHMYDESTDLTDFLERLFVMYFDGNMSR